MCNQNFIILERVLSCKEPYSDQEGKARTCYKPSKFHSHTLNFLAVAKGGWNSPTPSLVSIELTNGSREDKILLLIFQMKAVQYGTWWS